MSRRWSFAAVTLVAIAIAIGFVPEGAAETLTLATYNVENYGPADRMTEAGYRTSYPKPEREKVALRAVIRALNADVLVLQEMGPQPYLDDLRGEGCDYPVAELAAASDADRHVAILSRRPLLRVTTHRDLSFPYFGARETVKRGLLEATVTTASGEVTLFAVHLKSRFTDRTDDPLSAVRRAGEATAVRDRVLARFPADTAGRYVILGDCNDTRTSRAVAFLQKRGKKVLSTLLPAADSRGEVWTHLFHREETYSRVDLVFVAPALLPSVPGGAARVYDGPGVLDASDHRPVVVVLEL